METGAPLIGSVLSTDVSSCRNCGASLKGPYCAECGQKVADRPETLRAFVGEFFEELFDLRSRTLRSFMTLIRHPGELTASYFQGRKSRFAQPIQMYLIAATLFFVVNSVHSFIELRPDYTVESSLGLMRAGQQLSVAKIDSLTQHGISHDTFRERFKGVVTDTLPQFMFGTVFIFGLIVWLLHPRRPALHHFVFALHWTAFFLIVMACDRLILPAWPISNWIRALINVWGLVYLWLALRRTYGYGKVRAGFVSVTLMILFNVILIVWILSVGFFAFSSVAG